MHFKVFYTVQKENQIKYGLIKAVSFITVFFKKWLKENRIEMYSTHNKGKSAVAEKFIRTFKNKIYKPMTAVLKNVYFDVLNDIINKYNNTFNRTIKIKPADVKPDSYA